MKIEQFVGEYEFLSNFHPSPVELDGVEYPTVEHAFQAAKTLSKRQREIVLGKDTPGKAKRAGRKVTLREGWEGMKHGVMLDLLRKKFAHGTPLLPLLLNTGNAELVEGNNWKDTHWGVSLKTGKGQNWLGNLLMQVRNENGADSDES